MGTRCLREGAGESGRRGRGKEDETECVITRLRKAGRPACLRVIEVNPRLLTE